MLISKNVYSLTIRVKIISSIPSETIAEGKIVVNDINCPVAKVR